MHRYVRSHFVRLGGLSIAFLTLYLLTSQTDIRVVFLGLDFWPAVPNGVGIVVGMVFNFVTESLFTWQVWT